MKICKRNEDGHIFRLDVPHYFHKEDDSVASHYEMAIKHKLLTQYHPHSTNWTPEVFVFLQCQFCGLEEHVTIPISYLKTIIYDNDWCATYTTVYNINKASLSPQQQLG